MRRKMKYIPKLILILIVMITIACDQPTSPDELPPEVIITFPIDGSVINSSTRIKVEVSDNSKIQHVSFLIDGVIIGVDNSYPYEVNWNVAFWADGNTHSILAKATDKAGNVGQSDILLVTITKEAMVLPVLLSPLNEKIITDTDHVSFTWYSLPDAVEYDISISSDMDFSDIEYSATTADTSIAAKLTQGRHYWEVRGKNIHNLWSDWSEIHNFKIDGPLPPALISPAHNCVINDLNPVSFSWHSSPYSIQYDLVISRDAYFSYIDYSSTAKDTFTTSISMMSGSYYWRVRGQNSIGFWGEWSMINRLNIGSTFVRFYGGQGIEKGYSIQQTIDGGYILAGGTDSYGFGDRDAWLLKINAIGEEQWSYSYGGNYFDEAAVVHQTTDGGFILGGYSQSYQNNNEFWILKTNEYGTELWHKSYGGLGAYCYSIRETTDGGYISIGHAVQESTGPASDIWFVKVNSDGERVWDKFFGGTNGDAGYAVEQTLDGGYICTGGMYRSDMDLFLIKTDENGIEQWSKIFDYSNSDKGYSVQQNPDGGYIIVGSAKRSLTDDDVLLLKTDLNGDEQWHKTFGGTGNDIGYSIDQTSEGGYIITGFKSSSEMSDLSEKDILLIKTDINGKLQWSKTFGGPNEDEGRSVHSTFDGGYVITGSTKSYG
ncbi:hypothetical protein JXB12_08900, partial [candidate division KSB1 bacterium]|nr:hypothetical protein [candidate division KSB1 bacterium]